jgi:hypothetical protein
MTRPEPRQPGSTPTSARDLLERYTYGPGEIETILRFADEHNLLKDDFVWLLTSVLKVNTNLVTELLQAIAAGESWKSDMNGLWRDMSQHLVGLKDQLVGQLEGAAARSAGDIAVQVARLEALIQGMAAFNRNMVAVAKDFRAAREVFSRTLDTADQGSAFKLVAAHVAESFRPVLRSEVVAFRYEAQQQVQNALRALSVFGAAASGCLALMIWKVFF